MKNTNYFFIGAQYGVPIMILCFIIIGLFLVFGTIVFLLIYS